MTNLTVICASVFAITILLTGTITPALLIQEADAIETIDPYFRAQLTSNFIAHQPSHTSLPDVELLFVQSSTSGTFDDKEKTLTLVGISPATVYFSDRPNRITGSEDTESFVAMWSEGEDSFASDPPNAVLEMHGGDGQSDVFIIELMNPIYDSKDKTLQYTVEILAEASDGLTHYNDRSDSKIPATFEDAVLFIDGYHYFDDDIVSGPLNTVVPTGHNSSSPKSTVNDCSARGPGVNLHGCNLSGVNFHGVNLSGANLSHANLSHANLSSVNLSSVNLSHANLSGADLWSANLPDANLSDAYLPGAILVSANLVGADLSNTHLVGANLSSANLSGAILTDANLSDAYLVATNFHGANLSLAYIIGADLRIADLSDTSLRAAYLNDSNLSGADLSGADLSGAHLSCVNHPICN